MLKKKPMYIVVKFLNSQHMKKFYWLSERRNMFSPKKRERQFNIKQFPILNTRHLKDTRTMPMNFKGIDYDCRILPLEKLPRKYAVK